MEKSQTGQEISTCPLCNESLSGPPNVLANHLKRVHKAQSSKFQCTLCTASFGIKNTLYGHVREVHFRCLTCKATYPTKQALIQHENESNHNKCSVCKMFYLNLNEHFKHFHPNVKICNSTEERENIIIRSLKSVSNSANCPMCKKHIDNLPLHLKLKHNLNLTKVKTITLE